MPREIHLSSLVVHVRPERVAQVSDALERLGCEIHMATETGKLVVTLEADGGGALGETVTAVQRLDDVLAATLVFHHYEAADDDAEPRSGDAAPDSRRTSQEACP